MTHCSWQLSMSTRGALDRSYFIRVQTSLKDATYHVVFSDAGRVPPPFRIENFSKVSCIVFTLSSLDSRALEVKDDNKAWQSP